jgi:hypothetical protein
MIFRVGVQQAEILASDRRWVEGRSALPGGTGEGCSWIVSQVAWDTLGIIAAPVLFTWVFNHSRGSLLLALLFHASIAVTGLFLAVPDRHAAISTVLAWLLVGLVLWLDRPGLDLPE